MRKAISTETKAFFEERARKRKALGIVDADWSIRCDTAAHQSLTEFWSSYKKILGSERALDYLIWMMMIGYEGLVAAREKRKGKK